MASDEQQEITARARELGFASIGITTARIDARARARLREFVAYGEHGTMDWFSRRLAERLDPKLMWSQARTAFVLAVEYTPRVKVGFVEDMEGMLADKSAALVAHYAVGDDYHDVIKKRLKVFTRWLCARYDCAGKVFVDTAPLSEKALAARSGIGWQGKNTQLVSRDHGCWLFLGVVLSSRAFAPLRAAADSCGSCRRCIDICPTDAFPRPYVLDARKCISYLTIEHRGVIPRVFRAAIGNRVFGCDDCLTVCPWNKFALRSRDLRSASAGVGMTAVSSFAASSFAARAGMTSSRIADWLRLDDADFRRLFRANPIKRLGLNGLRRNLLIAAGNSGDRSLLPLVELALDDTDSVVRASAVWSYWRLVDRVTFSERAQARLTSEKSDVVLEEWRSLPRS